MTRQVAGLDLSESGYLKEQLQSSSQTSSFASVHSAAGDNIAAVNAQGGAGDMGHLAGTEHVRPLRFNNRLPDGHGCVGNNNVDARELLN